MRRRTFVLLATVVASCGIPVDTAPEPIDVEFAAAGDGASPIPGEFAAVSIYLVRNDSLVSVTRDLAAPTTLDIILDSLLGPVTEPEQRAGLRTAIPRGTESLAISESGATVVIDLNRDFAAVGGEEEVLAVAQIVMTVTGVAGIESVAFRLEGVPTDVPIASGALSADPVTADDYTSLLAP